jgi:hypothetical protein
VLGFGRLGFGAGRGVCCREGGLFGVDDAAQPGHPPPDQHHHQRQQQEPRNLLGQHRGAG